MKENQEISRGVALAVIMLDDMKHHVQPDGSISRCGDPTCPCEIEQDALDGYINLSAESVAKTEPRA